MIGASGAIGGVLGAYALLFPRAHVLVLVPLGFFITTVRVPALLVLGFWFVLQFLATTLEAGIRADIWPFNLMTVNQVGPVRFMLVGLILILLLVFRPQGIFGNRKELAFDVR